MAITDFERLFLDNLALIDRIVAAICRRNRLTKEESEDFASVVKLKFIDNDYAVLRKFTGKCNGSRHVYLVAVVQNAYRDHRNHLWGKWRPSAAARRLGPLAVKLDTLLHRDSLTLEEALALAAPEDRDEMQRLATKLPPRIKRNTVDIEEFDQLPSPDHSSEARLIEKERAEVAVDLDRVLAEAVKGLSSEDQLLIQLRLGRNLSLASVAKAFGVDPRQLYGQWDLIKRQLRTRLEKSGYSRSQVAWVLEMDRPSREGLRVGPSSGTG